jgi:hypothetical protein
MLLIAAVALLLAAGPGRDPAPGVWQVNGPAYSAIDLIAIAPDEENVVYVGAHDPDSGKSALFRTRDGGESWETVAEAPPGETLTSFAIDPTGPERMLALTKSSDNQGRLYRSDDGGQSWRSEPGQFTPDGAKIFFDPNFRNTAYFFSFRLQRSDDAGPWTKVPFPSPMASLWISTGRLFWTALFQPPNPRYPNLFPPGPPPPYWETFASATQGQTWSEVSGATCPDLEAVVFAPSDPLLGYATSTTCAPLVKSTDGGMHWNNLASHGFANWLDGLLHGRVEMIEVGPRAGNLFVTLLSMGEPSGLLLHSENGGWTWLPISVPATPTGPLAISPSGRFLYVGTDAGVFRLTLTETRVLPPRD